MLFIGSLPAHGQQLEQNSFWLDDFAGSVTVRPIELSERGDSLYFEMDVSVCTEAVNPRQSWTIVPVLSTEGDKYVITLPHLQFNGRVKDQLYRRGVRFNNREITADQPYVRINMPNDKELVLNYTAQIPYEYWMDTATLSIHQALSSPANKRQLFVVRDAGKVYLEPREPYAVQPQILFITPEKELKTRKMQGQAYLDFQVGRSVILPNFRRNPEELAKIAATVAQVRENPDVQIIGLFIEGYASPEGRYATNERLSLERAGALKDHMAKTLGLSEGLFRVSAVAEDWGGLRVLVDDSRIAQKERILDIIDSSDEPDRKEQRLRALGAPWRTMMNEMFPQLRRVDYQIDYSVKDYTLDESRELVGRSPEMLSQRELFLLAQSYPKESTEREQIFETMLRIYPEDTVAIINAAGMMLERGENTTAKRYLDRVAGDPRAWVNLGVYYLQTGELEQAAGYFDRVSSFGFEAEGRHNMEEVQKKFEDNQFMKRYER